jgi:hypothetical protein
MEHRSSNTDECHAHRRRERRLDFPDSARPHRKLRRADHPGRWRTAPERLPGDLRCCGPWNDLAIQRCNTVSNLDRHEDRRIDQRQTDGGDCGHSRPERDHQVRGRNEGILPSLLSYIRGRFAPLRKQRQNGASDFFRSPVFLVGCAVAGPHGECRASRDGGNLPGFYGAVVKLHTTLPASALPAKSLAAVVSVAV